MATTTDPAITRDELQLATRNHGFPLEILRHDITPIGLHYLLVHYDIPDVHPDAWSLEVRGAVHEPVFFGLEDLRRRPPTRVTTTMECAGNGRALLGERPISQPWLVEAVGTATWTGVRLADVLDEAGVSDDAIEVLFTGADRGVEGGEAQSYARALPIAECRRGDVLLAYEMNGVPLPPQHGFPLRLVVPGWYGMTNVKWLTSIAVLREPYHGYQQDTAYRFRSGPDDPGRPVSRMEPRSLMLPPGVPDFLTRRRFLRSEPVELTGRAWSGQSPIASAEVSTDGGATWARADLGPERSRYEWRRWTMRWNKPEPGEHTLMCRAVDALGHAQPTDESWNYGGYANTMVHRVPVTVTA